MSRLTWGDPGQRVYEAGVDRGVLYVGTQPGVSWNGLISVTEHANGGGSKAYYYDGVKYLNTALPEEFDATIVAITYPNEFAQCDGTSQPRPGLYLTQQSRSSFGLSYRTKIGSDQQSDAGYKIHIVYNALAAPSDRVHASLSNTTDPLNFTWNLTTRAPEIPGFKPTAHVVIDSRKTDPRILSTLEDILYGTDAVPARIPALDEIVAVYDAPVLVVVDNGDGTFTVTGPDSAVSMIDDSIFQITWPTAVFIDDYTYTVSS